MSYLICYSAKSMELPIIVLCKIVEGGISPSCLQFTRKGKGSI